MKFRRQVICRLPTPVGASRSPRLSRNSWEEMKIRSWERGEWNREKRTLEGGARNTVSDDARGLSHVCKNGRVVPEWGQLMGEATPGPVWLRLAEGKRSYALTRQTTSAGGGPILQQGGSRPLAAKPGKPPCFISTYRNVLLITGSWNVNFSMIVNKKKL